MCEKKPNCEVKMKSKIFY